MITPIQHWINRIFDITDQQSSTIIITLLVFITGGLVSAANGFIKNLSKRNAIRQQFYLLIENMASGAVMLAEKYRETVESLNVEGIKPITMGVVDFYQHTALKDIGFVTIFESLFMGLENRLLFRLFNRKKKIESFHNCWKALSSIPGWQEKAGADIKFALQYYNDKLEKRNAELTNFEKIVYELYVSLPGYQVENPRVVVNGILKVKEAWGKMANHTAPNIAQEHLVKPVLELTMNNTWDGAQRTRFCLLEAYSHYENMEKMIGVYKEQFGKYADLMKHNAIEIMDGIVIIRNIS